MSGEDDLKVEDFLDTIRPLISAHVMANARARVAKIEAGQMLDLITVAINSLPEDVKTSLWEQPFTVLMDDGSVFVVEWRQRPAPALDGVAVRAFSTFADLARDAMGEGGSDGA